MWPPRNRVFSGILKSHFFGIFRSFKILFMGDFGRFQDAIYSGVIGSFECPIFPVFSCFQILIFSGILNEWFLVDFGVFRNSRLLRIWGNNLFYNIKNKIKIIKFKCFIKLIILWHKISKVIFWQNNRWLWPQSHWILSGYAWLYIPNISNGLLRCTR